MQGLAVCVFVFVDRKVFGSILTPVFDRIVTILIGSCSVLIFLKQFGVLQATPAT